MTTPAKVSGLGTVDPRRRTAARVLGSAALTLALVSAVGLAPAEDVEPARKLIQSRNPGDRAAGIRMLGNATSEAATVLLLGELEDFAVPGSMQPPNNCLAMDALAKRREVRAVPAIVALLSPRMARDANGSSLWDHSSEAARALGQIGDAKAAAPLLAVLNKRLDSNIKQTRKPFDRHWNNPYPGVPLNTDEHFIALSKLGYTPCIPPVFKALRATRVIRNLGDGSQLPALETVPLYAPAEPDAHGNPQGRRILFTVLASVRGPATTAALVDLLATPTVVPSDFDEAISILSAQRDSTAIPGLVALLPTLKPAQEKAVSKTLIAITGDATPGEDADAWRVWLSAHREVGRSTSRPESRPWQAADSNENEFGCQHRFSRVAAAIPIQVGLVATSARQTEGCSIWLTSGLPKTSADLTVPPLLFWQQIITTAHCGRSVSVKDRCSTLSV